MKAHLQLSGVPTPSPCTHTFSHGLSRTPTRLHTCSAPATHAQQEHRGRGVATLTTPSPQEFTRLLPTGFSPHTAALRHGLAHVCTHARIYPPLPVSCLALTHTPPPRPSHTNRTLDSGPHSLSFMGLLSDLRLSLRSSPQPIPPGLPISYLQVFLALCFPLLTPRALVHAGTTGCVQRKQEPNQAPQIKRPGGVYSG